MQRRFEHEKTIQVPQLVTCSPVLMASVLNNSKAGYGLATSIVSLDCEYDADRDTNLKAPCKVTVVNQQGEVILDTLISQRGEGAARNLRREVWLHGIESKTIEGAPTLSQVKEHLFSVLPREKTVIVGHSVKQDLLVMELMGFHFIDTSIMHDPAQPRSLKEFSGRLLNAKIQSDGTTHSSIIDARASLALFCFFF